MEKKLEANGYEINYLPHRLWVKICISVLVETLEQIKILRKISNMPEMPPLFESYKPIKERFSEFVVPTIAHESMSKEQKDILTFRKNLAIIETAIKTTVDELLKDGSIKNLLDTVSVHKKLRSDEENLLKDTQWKQNEYKELDCTFYEEKVFYHTRFEEVMLDIGRTKDKIRNFVVEGEIKIKYVKEWQNAKVEQLDTTLERKEENTTYVLRRTEGDIFREMRIHEEILLAVDEMKKALEQQIEFWKEKYDMGVNRLDKKIKEVKQKKEKQQDRMNQLNAVYSERQGHIDGYKHYKVEQERKKEELKRKSKAATNIQAWWRGVMVRNGFGRFRKKKEKKGKKGGSAEKKENK